MMIFLVFDGWKAFLLELPSFLWVCQIALLWDSATGNRLNLVLRLYICSVCETVYNTVMDNVVMHCRVVSN